MTRSVLFTTSSIISMAAFLLAASCGHSQDLMDAFKESKSSGSGDGDTGGDGDATGDGDGDTGSGIPLPGFTACVEPDANLPKFSCTDEVASQQFDESSMKAFCVPNDVANQVNSTLTSMTNAQKASQMLGVPTGAMIWRDIERSPDTGDIRGYRYRDAGRGVNLDAGQDNRTDDMKNFATAFPVPSLRAASWDLDLERRIGAAIGDETAASLNNMNLGPCMNIVRHPYWGRTQETYGEDMYAIGRMSTAYTVGVQEYVVGCAKHFAANNVEKDRILQDAVMSEQTLREVYGRHFEMVVQDGAIGCIMAAYNLVNGVKATQHKHLLRDILKGPVSEGGMGFEGFVLTDWWAMPGYQSVPDTATAQSVTNEAVIAGTDVEVPWQLHYSEATLANADQRLVEDSARRVLAQKFLFKSAKVTDGWSKKTPTTVLDGSSLAPNPAHDALAEEGVVKSAVLIKNGPEDAPVLPLSGTTSIAVIGAEQEFSQIASSVPKTCGYDPDTGQGQVGSTKKCTFKHAEDVALGDRGSSRVNADPARSKGPYLGIKEIAGDDVTVTKGTNAAAVGDAEVVVVIVGYTPGDEGEEYYIAAGGDRSSLDLPAGQNDLVNSVLALNKPTIIFIQSGSIVNLPWLKHDNQNQATIWSGYPGMMAGRAYGRLIFGQDNFAGKMPMAWPSQAQMDKQLFKSTTSNVTEMGYFFGYRLYDKLKHVDQESVDLVFPFGHGLSFSTFEYSGLNLPCDAVSKEAIFEVTVDIKNTSTVDGDEVAMLFVKPPAKPSGITGERPWKELKSFARVTVPAGETVTAKLPLRVRDLRRWEGGEKGKWVIDSGEYTILVGKNADDAEAGTIMGTVTINGD